MASLFRFFAGLLICLLAGQMMGCATYEFNITQPASLRQHISDKPMIASVGPIEYTFQTVEGRLVIQLKNVSPDMLVTVGDQSREVDPSGQAHAIRSAILQPGGEAKLVLPPMPRLDTQGPEVGFGTGTGPASGGPEGDRLGFAWDDPRYAAGQENRQTWEWPADAEVSLILTFQHGTDKPFIQAWTFSKQKM